MKERIWLGLGIASVILTFSSILFHSLTSTVEADWVQSGNPGLTNGVGQTTAYGNATRVAILAPSSDITATGTISGYFPFVGKAPTPTPTNVPTPTPIPNPIVNGGFEQQAAGWYASLQIPYNGPPQGWVLAVSRNDLPSPVSPHSGDWVAWLGGYTDSTTTLQTANPFTIPSGGSTLRYWLWIQSDEPTCDINNVDGAWVFIAGSTLPQTQIDGYAMCQANQTNNSWVKHDINLAGYAGQSVYLSFTARILGQNSNWFIDDVQMGTLTGSQFAPYLRMK